MRFPSHTHQISAKFAVFGAWVVLCHRSVHPPTIHNVLLKKRGGYRDDRHWECVRSPVYPALFSRAPCPTVEYDHQDASCVLLIKGLHCQRQYTQYNELSVVISTPSTNLYAEEPVSLAGQCQLLLAQPRRSREFPVLLSAPEWVSESLLATPRIPALFLCEQNVQIQGYVQRE